MAVIYRDTYRGLRQGLMLAVQGLNRGLEQRRLINRLGPDHPLARLIPFMSPQQASMMLAQQALQQGQQGQQGIAGLTVNQILSQMNNLRTRRNTLASQRRQIYQDVNNRVYEGNPELARQQLARIDQQEQQLLAAAQRLNTQLPPQLQAQIGQPGAAQQGGIMSFLGRVFGRPQRQTQARPQIQLPKQKPANLPTDNTTAGYWTARFPSISNKKAVELARDTALIKAGKMSSETARQKLSKWQTIKRKTLIPELEALGIEKVLKGQEETAALADRAIAIFRKLAEKELSELFPEPVTKPIRRIRLPSKDPLGWR